MDGNGSDLNFAELLLHLHDWSFGTHPPRAGGRPPGARFARGSLKDGRKGEGREGKGGKGREGEGRAGKRREDKKFRRVQKLALTRTCSLHVC